MDSHKGFIIMECWGGGGEKGSHCGLQLCLNLYRSGFFKVSKQIHFDHTIYFGFQPRPTFEKRFKYSSRYSPVTWSKISLIFRQKRPELLTLIRMCQCYLLTSEYFKIIMDIKSSYNKGAADICFGTLSFDKYKDTCTL